MTKIKSSGKGMISILIGLAILIVGIGGCRWMIATRPEAQKRVREKQIPIVDVLTLKPSDVRVKIEAMGTVIPAVKGDLQPEVNGAILWTHPEFYPGAVVTAGTPLVKIDMRDYAHVLDAKKAAYAIALADLEIEKGQQDIARQEWKLIGADQQSEMDEQLALRYPQLAQREASKDAARAEAERAQLNVEKTTIRAPFDATILSTHADVGDRASVGSVVAVLAGSDEYWIRATLKSSDLQWLYDSGAENVDCEAEVTMAGGEQWPARFLSVLPAVQESGRMAQVLFSVADPLQLQNAQSDIPLLLGSYVHTVVCGRTIENVLEIPRDSLREGGYLWVLAKEHVLAFVPVDILWETESSVYAANTFDGPLQLIVSGIGTPVEGMTLMTETEAREKRAKDARTGEAPTDESKGEPR